MVDGGDLLREEEAMGGKELLSLHEKVFSSEGAWKEEF